MSSLSSIALRRLNKELSALQNTGIEGCRIIVDDGDIANLTAWIEGPRETPYAGGYFKIRFQFGSDFPAAPPKCWFATKIFHPNVSEKGEICVNTLKKDWKKEYGIGHILTTIKCLLIYPNPESALHEESGRLLLEDYEQYSRHASLMTSIHARARPAEFSPPSPTISTISTAPQQQQDSSSAKSKVSAMSSSRIRSTSPAVSSAVLQPAAMNMYMNRSSTGMELDLDENNSALSTTSAASSRKRTVTNAMGPSVVDARNGTSMNAENKLSNITSGGSNAQITVGTSSSGKGNGQAAKRKGLRRL